MADEPDEMYTTIDNEPGADPEEAPKGVNPETGEVIPQNEPTDKE